MNKPLPPLVSIIIVNWNGRSWLEKCFASLSDVTYKNIEIILVDNSSTDDSVSWTQKNYPSIKIITVSSNEGFAQANNLGFAAATGEYVYFLNNDTVVMPDFLQPLVTAFIHDPKLGGVQSKLRLMDNPNMLDTIGAFLTPTGFLYHFAFMNLDHNKYDRRVPLFTAKGAGMMFRKSVLTQIQVDGALFDPSFFAYFEETDMCHRVWLAGYTIAYIPTSVIFHKMGATSTRIDNAYIQYHSFKNRIASYIKNLSTPVLLRILPIHIICIEIFATVALLKRKPRLWWAIQRAIVWNITHLSMILKKRTTIQHTLRKVTDKELMPIILKTPPLSYYVAQMSGKAYEE